MLIRRLSAVVLAMIAAASYDNAAASDGVPAADSPAPSSSEPTWLIAPYLWGPSAKGSVGINGNKIPVDVDVRELASGVNAGAMGYLQWTRGKHFVYAEGLGIRFDDDQFAPFFNQAVSASLAFAEVGYGQHLALDVSFPAKGRMQLSPYAGLRYAMLHVTVTNPQQSMAANEKWLDPALGLITEAPLYGRLSYAFKLDAAGFGLGRDHYWSGTAVLRYPLSQALSIAVGYRAARFDADPGGGNDLTLRLRCAGPDGGLTYSF